MTFIVYILQNKIVSAEVFQQNQDLDASGKWSRNVVSNEIGSGYLIVDANNELEAKQKAINTMNEILKNFDK